MSGKYKSVKMFLPAMGIIFGAGAGMLVPVFYDLQMPFGVVFGAAAGLLIGLVFSNLFGGKDGPKNDGRT